MEEEKGRQMAAEILFQRPEFHPNVTNVSWSKNKISIFDQFHVEVHIQNNLLALESVVLVLSRNNFSDYFYYQLNNRPVDEDGIFNFITNKMDKGTYSFLMIARDYSNYLDILYKTTFKLTIYILPMHYLIMISSISLILVIIIIGYFALRRTLKHFKYRLNDI